MSLPRLLVACLTLAACDSAAVPEPPSTGCRPGPGASGAPSSIAAAVALINTLPRPVTVACLVESLDRPLHVTATNSILSLQPAVGSRSPRVLLLGDRLIMSIVFDGKGRNLVELGEFVTANRTLKAEIPFPLTAELPTGLPFARIRYDLPDGGQQGTTCRFCHRDEQPAPDVDGAAAWTSVAFKPDRRTKVPLESIRDERRTCDPALEPDRCELLRAFLDHGAVEEGDLPAGVGTIFQ